MFHFIGNLIALIGGLIGLGITVVGGIFMFSSARQFVRNRLRFVDGVDNPILPFVVGAVGVAALGLLFSILPIVGFTTALVLGGSAGLGTASGVKALKRGD